jgi:hypothetical protein
MSLKSKNFVNACKRRPLLCICIGSGLILLLVFYFRMNLVVETETTLAERSQHLKKLKTNAIYATQLEQQIKTLKDVNQALADGALREGELAKNQQLFLRLEAETGVKLLDMKAQPVPPAPKVAGGSSYVPISFSLTISGDYKQLITFLKRLDQGPTLCRVVNAAISGTNTGPQTMSLSVELLGLRR